MGKRLAIVLLASVLWAGHASAVTISLEPAAQTAAPGDTVAIDLWVRDLGAFGSDSVGAFEFDILYDASALTHTSGSIDPDFELATFGSDSCSRLPCLGWDCADGAIDSLSCLPSQRPGAALA